MILFCLLLFLSAARRSLANLAGVCNGESAGVGQTEQAKRSDVRGWSQENHHSSASLIGKIY